MTRHPSRHPSPTTLLIHGYGTHIESAFAQPRGRTAGFYAFEQLMDHGVVDVFRWEIPFKLKFPQNINPFYLLTIYQREKAQLDNKNVFERLDATIKDNNIEILISHSLGSQLLLQYLQNYTPPTSVKRIITIQSDMPRTFQLPIVIENRLKNGALRWDNYWCWWDQALFASCVVNRSWRAGVVGVHHPLVHNSFFPLYRDGNLHISTIIDPEFVKRLQITRK